MTCRELVQFLIDYLEGGLESDERASFERHLAACPQCRTYLSSYRMSVELMRSALREPDGDLEEQMPPEMVKAILESRRNGKTS